MNINNAVSVNCGQKRDSACKVKNLDNKVIKIYSDFEFEEGLVKFGIFKDRSEEIPKIRSKIPNLRMLRASKKCQKMRRCKQQFINQPSLMKTMRMNCSEIPQN